jgi:hypothetical protein
MKKGILYIVLLTYASMMSKPVLPYVADVINHALFYNDHMAKVHFEDGKFHVHEEAMDAARESNEASKNTVPKKETNWDHIINLVNKPVRFSAAGTNFHEFKVPHILIVFTGQHYPPPRSCV